MPKRYNIVVPKKYQKSGEEKTAWLNVGKLVYFPAAGDKTEGFVFELSMFPETTFKVFPEKERDQQQMPRIAPQQDANAEFDKVVDEINPDDIPF